jgi:hypothetical protein
MSKPLQHQIIARALEIVSDPTKWTRGSMARTADGKACASLDPLAVRFCAVGALFRAAGELLGANEFALGRDGFAQAVEAEKFLLAANNLSDDGVPRINDVEGREAIVAMFRVALAQ